VVGTPSVVRHDEEVTRTTRRHAPRRPAALLIVAATLALAACSSGSATPSGSATATSQPSPTGTGPVNPLTGLAGPSGPVVAVKVANTKEARPQSGLTGAAQVWVEEIEGGHLRFIAVYAGSYAAKIGPVRSARETDLGILPQFGRPGFAYAGADAPVQAEVVKASKDGAIVDLGKDAKVGGVEVRTTSYSTDPARTVPYNFYANGPALASFATKGGATPPATGGFRFGAAASGSTPCTTLSATWSKTSTGGARWDASTNAWVIQFDGQDLLDRESGAPISTTDVVVLRMHDVASTIDRSNYKVPVLQSYGPDGGDATVLRDGTCTTGHWSRPTLDAPTVLTTAGGSPMTLAPGRSWVFTVGIGPSLNDGTERTATTS
jgi:Protein of unknown function (DUF3048) N-terminal domain/Protein of unknown function (DUF3048) C-terminal domain